MGEERGGALADEWRSTRRGRDYRKNNKVPMRQRTLSVSDPTVNPAAEHNLNRFGRRRSGSERSRLHGFRPTACPGAVSASISRPAADHRVAGVEDWMVQVRWCPVKVLRKSAASNACAAVHTPVGELPEARRRAASTAMTAVVP